MPKVSKRLTQVEINKIKYISMADFSKKIDSIENIDDKLKFARQYLVLHGTNGEPDCSLEDAINIARMKIADAAYELKVQANKNNDKVAVDKEVKEDDDLIEIVVPKAIDKKSPYQVNPFATKEKDMELESFMGRPVEYLKNYALKTYNDINNDNIEIINESVSKENYMKFYNKTIGVDVGLLNPQARGNLHINSRLEAMFGGKAALEKAYRDTKPSFFSKMFQTSSVAAGNLDKVYSAFNNPAHVLYGDINSLSKAANEYLMHKIPGWKVGDPYPNKDKLDNLDETSKARTVLSIAILKAADKEHKNEEVYETIVKGCAADENLKNELDRSGAANQEIFQRKLMEDLNDDLDQGIIMPEVDNNDIKLEKQAQNENNLDESKLDKSEISVLELKKQEE